MNLSIISVNLKATWAWFWMANQLFSEFISIRWIDSLLTETASCRGQSNAQSQLCRPSPRYRNRTLFVRTTSIKMLCNNSFYYCGLFKLSRKSGLILRWFFLTKFYIRIRTIMLMEIDAITKYVNYRPFRTKQISSHNLFRMKLTFFWSINLKQNSMISILTKKSMRKWVNLNKIYIAC